MVKLRFLLVNRCTNYLTGAPGVLKSTVDLLVDEPNLENFLRSGYKIEKGWTSIIEEDGTPASTLRKIEEERTDIFG